MIEKLGLQKRCYWNLTFRSGTVSSLFRYNILKENNRFIDLLSRITTDNVASSAVMVSVRVHVRAPVRFLPLSLSLYLFLSLSMDRNTDMDMGMDVNMKRSHYRFKIQIFFQLIALLLQYELDRIF
jgi:hypothetical protein